MSIEGIDYAFSHPSISAIKQNGKKFVVRYLSNRSPDGSDLDKTLSVSEAKQLRASGLPVGLVFETTAGRATAGRGAGQADAKTAERHRKVLGAPESTALYFAVDDDLSGQSVDGYFRGVRDVLPKARVGAYAGVRPIRYLFDRGLIGKGWQTYAWSNGAWDNRAKLQQYKNGVSLGGADCDLCRTPALGLAGLWGAGDTLDVLSYLTKGEKELVQHKQRMRARAKKAGGWKKDPRAWAAAKLDDLKMGRIVARLKKFKDSELDQENRRERLELLRDARASRPLSLED